MKICKVKHAIVVELVVPFNISFLFFQISKDTMNKAMLTALFGNKADFVQLFLDNGVRPWKFLTGDILEKLYEVSKSQISQ